MATILASLSIGSLLAAAGSGASAVGLTGLGGALGTAGTALTGFGASGGALGALGGGLASTGIPGLTTVGSALAEGAGAVGGLANATIPGLGVPVHEAVVTGGALGQTGAETASTLGAAGEAVDAAQANDLLMAGQRGVESATQRQQLAAMQMQNAPFRMATEAPTGPTVGEKLTQTAIRALRASSEPAARGVILNEMDRAQERREQQAMELAAANAVPRGGPSVFPQPQVGFGQRLAASVSRRSRGNSYVPGLG